MNYDNLAERIVVLFRAADTMQLWGLPYRMRDEVSQSPRHLWNRPGYGGEYRAPGPLEDWIYLGSPGWWGHLNDEQQTAVKEFLSRVEWVPEGPYEWCYAELRKQEV